MADQMDIDTPSEEHHSKTTTTTTTTNTQPQQQTQPPPPKKASSSSSTRELTTCTIKHPPFSYVHLSTVDSSPPPEQPQGASSTTTPTETDNLIDPLQVRSYCTAALRQFLGETGTSIVPDILLIAQRKQQSGSGVGRNGRRPTSSAQDIYLRLAREDLATFAAAMAAFPGSWTTTTTASGNGKGGRLLLLQVQSCGDWLGGLIGKSEEVDVWGL